MTEDEEFAAIGRAFAKLILGIDPTNRELRKRGNSVYLTVVNAISLCTQAEQQYYALERPTLENEAQSAACNKFANFLLSFLSEAEIEDLQAQGVMKLKMRHKESDDKVVH